MIRSVLFLAMLSLPALTATAQTPAPAAEPVVLIGTYRLTFQPDSTDPAKRTETMVLTLGKTLSKFESLGTQLSDSMLAANTSARTTPDDLQALTNKMRALPRIRFRYAIYKTAAGRQVTHYEPLGMSTFRYDEPAGALTWTIVPGAPATIAGYSCQQATASFGGRRWQAWFTREVPVPEGPYKFGGLPGLIVKVADTRGYYTFELLQLRKPATERLVALPTKAATAATKAEFRQAAANFNLNPMASIQAASGGAKIMIQGADGQPQSPEQLQQMMRERARKNNNPLELR